MLEWRKLTFGDLGTLFDGPHATPTRRTEGPYFLNIASLKSGRLDLAESDHVSPADFAKWTRRVTPRGNDLLFSYETRLGEAALMPEDLEACLGRRMALLRPDKSIVDPRFLLYFFLSPPFQQTITKHTIHGATVPRIGLATMSQWEIEIPPLRDQQATAAVLGALDDKIAANERIARRSFELARTTFHRDLSRGSTGYVTLAELRTQGWLHVSDGYRTKRSEQGQPGLRILRAGDVGADAITPTGQDFVSDEFRGAVGSKASHPGDIVMTTKGTVGHVAVVPEDVEQLVYSPQLCYFRILDPDHLAPGFLSGWFRSDSVQRQAEARMFKSDMAPYINLKDIQSMTIPLVTPVEQQRIGKAQSALERVANAVGRENQVLAGVRDELLPLLMSGKVRVEGLSDGQRGRRGEHRAGAALRPGHRG